MSITKHTPGPWIVNGRAIEEDKPKMAHVIGYVEDEQNDAWSANAKLIAAAPVLADALERAYRLIDEDVHGARRTESVFTLGEAIRIALRAAGRLP